MCPSNKIAETKAYKCEEILPWKQIFTRFRLDRHNLLHDLQTMHCTKIFFIKEFFIKHEIFSNQLTADDKGILNGKLQFPVQWYLRKSAAIFGKLTKFVKSFICSFLNSYLAVLKPSLSHQRGDSHPMLITAYLLNWIKNQRGPCNVRSQNKIV